MKRRLKFLAAFLIIALAISGSVPFLPGLGAAGVSADNGNKPQADLEVHMFNGNKFINSLYISPYLRVYNTGSKPELLKNIKIRYYFTADDNIKLSFSCLAWKSKTGPNVEHLTQRVIGSFVKMSPAKQNADYYLEISFDNGTGNLHPGEYVEIHGIIIKDNLRLFNQKNDYSFRKSGWDYEVWDKVTAYISNSLVFGIEPPAGTPEEPGNEDIEIRMYNFNREDETEVISPYFMVVNTGDSTIDLKDITARYYYTSDSEREQEFTCYYAARNESEHDPEDETENWLWELIKWFFEKALSWREQLSFWGEKHYQWWQSCKDRWWNHPFWNRYHDKREMLDKSDVTSSFVKLDDNLTGADHYIEIGFKPGSGELKPGESITVWFGFSSDDMSKMTQNNDYSFNPTAEECVIWERMTGYIDGYLAWGIEPYSTGVTLTSPVDGSYVKVNTPVIIKAEGVNCHHIAVAVIDPQGNESWIGTQEGSVFSAEYTFSQVGDYTLYAASRNTDDYLDDGTLRAESARITVHVVDLRPPEGLKAVYDGENKTITLSWDEAENAQGYIIKRKTGDDGEYVVLAENVKNTSFTDDNLEERVVYHYVVASVSGQVVSEDSLPVSCGTFPTPFSTDDEFFKYQLQTSLGDGSSPGSDEYEYMRFALGEYVPLQLEFSLTREIIDPVVEFDLNIRDDNTGEGLTGFLAKKIKAGSDFYVRVYGSDGSLIQDVEEIADPANPDILKFRINKTLDKQDVVKIRCFVKASASDELLDRGLNENDYGKTGRLYFWLAEWKEATGEMNGPSEKFYVRLIVQSPDLMQ
jgi:hypothetical protein